MRKDLKTFLDDELVKAKKELQTAKIETAKVTALQAMSNLITLLTQLAQLETQELNNIAIQKQLVEDSKKD